MRIQLQGRGKLLFSFRFLTLFCAVLIVGVGVVTATAYTLVRERVTYRTNLKFEEITSGHVNELFHSFETYSNALYATRGLFAGADVTATTWDRFIGAQGAPQRFVGMKALAYAQVVPHEKIDGYERMLRNTQHEKITIHPLKNRSDYVILTYHEDVTLEESERLNALGFDLASDPERFDTITRANRSNAMAATGPVSLATNSQMGFLLLLPLTDRFSGPDTKRPFGYSVAAFDMDKLVDTTIGPRLKQYNSSIQITDITDGKNISLYKSGAQDGQYLVSRSVTMQVADRTWKMTFKAPSSNLVMAGERFAPKIILAVGAGITIAICAALYMLRLRSRLIMLVAADEEKRIY